MPTFIITQQTETCRFCMSKTKTKLIGEQSAPVPCCSDCALQIGRDANTFTLSPAAAEEGNLS